MSKLSDKDLKFIKPLVEKEYTRLLNDFSFKYPDLDDAALESYRTVLYSVESLIGKLDEIK